MIIHNCEEKKQEKQQFLEVARGDKPCDLVLKNGQVVNVFSHEVIRSDVGIHNGVIAGVGDYHGKEEIDLQGKYLAPGFIEAHIHIESSMLTPAQFARAVAPHGTTSVICDPHEIANVLGVEGIKSLLAGKKDIPIDIMAMIPSCVPATHLETSGAEIEAEEIKQLLELEDVPGLAEMMNFPGTIYGLEDVLAKIRTSLEKGLPVDGHAPGLRGKELQAYVGAGISSDHECSDIQEAREKLRAGMFIFIRQGSTAKNMAALLPLVTPENISRCILVSDDCHPDDLYKHGHLNHILSQAVNMGLDPISAIRMVTINPALYFNLKRKGSIAPGYMADMVVLDDLVDFEVKQVFKEGREIAVAGKPLFSTPKHDPLTEQGSKKVNINWDKTNLAIKAEGKKIRVIELVESEIITKEYRTHATIEADLTVSDQARDIIKVAVLERHKGSGNTGLGFVKGLGLKNGAIASTVAHDSHNLIVVGTDDILMLKAARLLADCGGGLSVVGAAGEEAVMGLSVAGLMSDKPVEQVSYELAQIKEQAKKLGCRGENPFMLLSFLALPVIPELKITDLGLVDVNKFALTSLWVE